MRADALAAGAIFERLQTEPKFRLTAARKEYRNAFGISHKHRRIDQEYMEIIGSHFGLYRSLSTPRPNVAIPIRIALAFFLREMKGRKNKTPLALQQAKKAQIEEFLRVRAEIMAANPDYSTSRAEQQAAEQVEQTFEWRGARRSFLTAEQTLEIHKHRARYGLPGIRKLRE
jgi:hypothetical protein